MSADALQALAAYLSGPDVAYHSFALAQGRDRIRVDQARRFFDVRAALGVVGHMSTQETYEALRSRLCGARELNAGEHALFGLLREFFAAWTRAESARGCYSCCPRHDARCQYDRGLGECNCGRDVLERLAQQLEARLP